MKTSTRLVVFTSVFMLFAAFYACTPDTPDPVVVDPRDKFEGNWTCQEFCSSDNTNTTFSVSISTNSTTESEILISNFSLLGAGYSAKGIVSDYNLTIPSQTVSSNTVQGTGTMNTGQNSISLSYTINDGAATFSYTATYTKQ
ncbi:MAG: hypothetical protein V2A54_07465 [Bacteroidota bacterium]